MSLNPLDVYLVSRELESFLKGARIREIRVANHSLWVRMDHPPHLLVSLHPSHLGVALSEEISGEAFPSFTQLLRKRRIQIVRTRAGDRILFVRAGDRALVVELTGKHRNVFVLDEDTRVLATRYAARIAPGDLYSFPPPPHPDFRILLQTRPDRLYRVAPYLERVPDPLAYVCTALRHPQPVLVEHTGKAFLAPYPVPLQKGERMRPLATFSEGFLILLPSEKEAAAPRQQITPSLRERLERERARLAHHDAYRRIAERILREFPTPPPQPIPLLENDVEVVLHPEDNPIEVAESLFARYKKMKRGYETLSRRLAALEEGRPTPSRTPSSLPAREVRRPYRVFRGPGGSRILVGRSAADNHRLTFHFAPPHAWWFHGKDIPGAHVVIPDPHPPSRDLEEAARIALWFSDARDSGSGEVWVTRRRFVRSVPGQPGKVRIQKGEVWRVLLPEGWSPTSHER